MRWIIEGVNLDTGEDCTIAVDAPTQAEAERIARYRRVLVSKIEQVASDPPPAFCPVCKSENICLSSVAVARETKGSSMFAVGGHGEFFLGAGGSQSDFAKVISPRLEGTKSELWGVWPWLFLGIAALLVVGGFNQLSDPYWRREPQQVWGAFVFGVLSAVAAIPFFHSAKLAKLHNVKVAPMNKAAIERWSRSWVCMKCANQWVP